MSNQEDENEQSVSGPSQYGITPPQFQPLARFSLEVFVQSQNRLPSSGNNSSLDPSYQFGNSSLGLTSFLDLYDRGPSATSTPRCNVRQPFAATNTAPSPVNQEPASTNASLSRDVLAGNMGLDELHELSDIIEVDDTLVPNRQLLALEKIRTVQDLIGRRDEEIRLRDEQARIRNDTVLRFNLQIHELMNEVHAILAIPNIIVGSNIAGQPGNAPVPPENVQASSAISPVQSGNPPVPSGNVPSSSGNAPGHPGNQVRIGNAFDPNVRRTRPWYSKCPFLFRCCRHDHTNFRLWCGNCTRSGGSPCLQDVPAVGMKRADGRYMINDITCPRDCRRPIFNKLEIFDLMRRSGQ